MIMIPIVVFERRVPGVNSRVLENFVTGACKASGVRGAVSVLITGNVRIRNLNLRFRGNKSATDVLSFPAGRSQNGFAGDIAISLDIAKRNARSLGHSVSDEIRILILHGILHLAGYDHENDGGKMAAKEARLRQSFGLPTGLIERNSGHPADANSPSAVTTVKREKRQRS
jgi:probable rRNA maturation factor